MRIGYLLRPFIIIGVLIELYTLYRVYNAQGLGPYSPGALKYLLQGTALSLFFVLLDIGILLVQRHFQRNERHLQELQDPATWGDRLAYAQPVPNSSALSLPRTIRLFISWPKAIFQSVLCLLVGALVVGVATGLRGDNFPTIFSNLPAGMFLGFFFACFVVASASQRIDITEQGLSVYSVGHTSSIGWSEALLFAVDRSGTRKQQPTRYLLSGKEQQVRWERVYRSSEWGIHPFRRAVKPVLPFDDYEQEMDAFLSVVAAKTRLPLVDLRDHPQ
jgi:hypothetical protein